MESQRGNPVWFLALTMGFVFGAIACGGGSNKSPTARLDAPTGLSATTTGAGELRLDWNVVAGATSYDLYMSTSPGVTKATGSLIAGVFPPHPLSGLANGTTYYFVATAIDTAGGTPESLASTEALGVPDTLGILHTTFGSGGVAVHDNAAGGGGLDIGVDIALDSSGRILVVGTADNGIDLDMVIWRYTSAGALDTTFNGQGWVVHDNAAGGVGNDYGRAIALDFSGRILVAGNGDGDPTAGTDLDMVIWRYSSGGTLDTTFDGRGWVVHDNAAGGGGDDYGLAIAPDSSGRILVAGNSDRDPTAGLNDDMVIWRYSSGGTLDTTFNSQGWVVHDGAAGGAGPDIGVSIALDTSGRILVAGNSDSDPTAGFSDDMVIWRYTFAGTLDTTFNGQGWVVHDSAAGGAGPDVGVGIAQDASGRIFVAGYSDRDPSTEITMDMVIWQYTSGGTLDTAFNGQGWVVHDNAAGGGGFDIGVGIVLDASGRILVAGYSDSDPTGVPGYDMAIWRYTSAGTVDATFNGQGWVVHDSAAAGGGDDFGLALAQDAYGRILVAGYSDSDPTVGTDFDMVIWRFK